MILLGSTMPKGVCYVETKGLDGETNLKQKMCRTEIAKLGVKEEVLFKNFTGATVTCDLPNANLYKFEGQLKMPSGELIPLSSEQLLLKGCQLRNTGHIFGVAVYTGH